MKFLLLATLAFAKPAFVLSDKGYGPVIFGNKLAEVEKTTDFKAKVLGEGEEPTCWHTEFKELPGVSFMVENDIVTRAQPAEAGSLKNTAGIKIGMAFSAVKKKFPKIEIKAHTYRDHGHYLTLKSKDGKRALVFEEDEGKVIAMRGGLEPSVGYVEGCQ
jgi:hypothetical protein